MGHWLDDMPKIKSRAKKKKLKRKKKAKCLSKKETKQVDIVTIDEIKKEPTRFIGATVLDEMWDYVGITNENSSIDTSKDRK